MRNPDLNSKPGPKQRPRAVVENVVKEFQHSNNLATPAVDVRPSVCLAAPACSYGHFDREDRTLVSVQPVCSVSRAPPLIHAA